jgi:redox-sensing transcriptional repressor
MKNKLQILRLARYKRVLANLKALGFRKAFANNLAEAAGVTPSLVRKDFSLHGIFGNKRGGYLIDLLLVDIERVIGKDSVEPVILVGCGSLGTALLRYNGFEKEMIRRAAAFDNDPARQDAEGPIPILPIAALDTFIRNEGIRVAILAVPGQVAQVMLEQLVHAGIRGVLNFAPVYLHVPPPCTINNVNMELELESVIYSVRHEAEAAGAADGRDDDGE